MPINDITPYQPQHNNAASNMLMKSMLEAFRRSLSNQEVSFVDDGLYTIPGSTSVISPETTAAGAGPGLLQTSGQMGYQEKQFGTQEPQATIYIKKKVFSTLRDSFDTTFLGDDEKFFLRATKKLFSNKANEVAMYERLTKTQSFINEGAVRRSDVEWMATNLFAAGMLKKSEVGRAWLKIKDANVEENETTYTNWIIGIREKDETNIGLGVGVIELTAFTNLSTRLSLADPGDLGSCSLSIEDPYHIMFIKVEDIDKAIMETRPIINMDPKAKEAFDKANEIEQEFRKKYGATIDIGFNTKAGTVNDPVYVVKDVDDKEAEKDAQKLKIELEKYVNIVGQYEEDIKERNEAINFTRNKMLKFYSGKAIVQPMDSINIFVNSNTTLQEYEEGTYVGLASHESRINADKAAVLKDLGSDTIDKFSDKQYRFLRRKDAFYGAPIFTGVVDSATDSYNANAGKYTLNISASNNMKWLKISRINQAPALKQQHGMLEDPLTPFLIKPDEQGVISSSALELLPENKALLNSNVVSIRGGLFDGKIVTEQGLMGSGDDFGRNKVAAISHVPGLKYRWKEGLFTATQRFNIKSPGVGFESREDMTRLYGITLTSTPFDNLDAANIISLLVTGYPYNFEKFIRNATDAGNFNPTAMFNGGEDYFSNLFDAVRTQNNSLGNFVPYATIGADRASYLKNNLNVDKEVNKANSAIRRLRIDIAREQDKLAQLLHVDPKIATNEEMVARKISLLEKNTKARAQQLNKRIGDLEKTLLDTEKKYADIKENENSPADTDISCRFSNSGSGGPADEETKDQKLKEKLQNGIYKRKTDVKYNRDVNLFIVSDEYEKDVDIQAFTLNLKSQPPEMFEAQGAYDFPLDRCVEVAKYLNFELFADQNGHIHFRPPQYNKTPVTILNQMFKRASESNIRTFNPFLTNIFVTKKKMAEDKLLEIRRVLEYKEGLKEGNVPQVQEAIKVKEGEFPLQNVPKDLDVKNTVEVTKFVKKSIDSNVKVALLTNEIKEIVNRMVMLENYVMSADEADVKREGALKTERDSAVADVMFNPLNYHLIEFDTINEIGYGSGRRFIINDSVITDYSFVEGDQGVITRVDVLGKQSLIGNDFGTLAMPQDIWAGAVDYDLWQQYGYRYADAQKPFFNDAESQCRPYAAFLLNRQRRDIIKGSVSVVGNEFYQLGDVVYITDREMLYYVSGISHTFDYAGGNFSTKLDLRYGHVPGDYIASPLDIIGQTTLAGKRREFNFVRQNSIGKRSERVLSAISFTKLSDDKTTFRTEPKNMIALKNSYLIAKNYLKKNNEIRLLLRAFYNEGEKKEAKKNVALTWAWFNNPQELDGSPIGALTSCTIENKEKNILGEVAKYLSASELSELNAEKDLVLSPSEETLDLVSSGKEIKNVVEIILSFETDEHRKGRLYYNALEKEIEVKPLESEKVEEDDK